MNIVRLIPVFMSFLLIAAHFQRAGSSYLAIFCLLGPLLLLFTRSWSVRIVQGLMYISALEWLRTLYFLINMRLDAGLPWGRLALILGGVALFTALSTLIFRHPAISKKYNLHTLVK